MQKVTKLARGLSVVVGLLYPLLVFFGLSYFSVAEVTIVLMVIVGLRVLAGMSGERKNWAATLALVAVAGAGMGVLWFAFRDNELALLLVPAAINAVMLAVFGLSLRSVPIIERFARRFDPELSEAKQAHCREFTVLWCFFFVVNGTACVLLALFAPRAWWAAYTGGISYVLMGVLFALEFIVRRYRFRQFSEFLPDQWLRRLLSDRTSRIDV